MVHANDAYANGYAEGLRKNGPTANVTVAVSASFESNDPSTHSDAVVAVKQAGVNIVIGLAFDTDFLGIAKLAQEQGIYGPGYAWILSDGTTRSAANQAPNFGLSSTEAASMMSGLVTFFASPAGSPGYARFLSDWSTHVDADCDNSFFDVSEWK